MITIRSLPTALWLMVVLPMVSSSSGFAQNRRYLAAFEANRHTLVLKDGALSGNGLAVLQSAVADAQFVMVGDGEGTAEPAKFSAALFRMLAPHGFHTLAIETGPLGARKLEEITAHPDGKARLSALLRVFPDSIPYYDWNEQFELVATAHEVCTDKTAIWGLDQEFSASAGLILAEILKEPLGPESIAEARALLARDAEATTAARKSGQWSQLLMASISEKELLDLRDLLKRDGTPLAVELVDRWLQSKRIYAKTESDSKTSTWREGYQQRVALMKSTFMRYYTSALAAGEQEPKVFFKFGQFHLYKGNNPNHVNDLGNWIMELAEENNQRATNIAVIEVNGKTLKDAAGLAQAPAAFDNRNEKESDFPWLIPLFRQLGDTRQELALYDLRPIRGKLDSLGKVDPEVERLIEGYDLLLLIPNATAVNGPIAPE